MVLPRPRICRLLHRNRKFGNMYLRACLKNLPGGLVAGRAVWRRCSPVTDFSRICFLVTPRHPVRRARNPVADLFFRHALTFFFRFGGSVLVHSCTVLTIALFYFPIAAWATTWVSATANESDVKAAISRASAGDLVIITNTPNPAIWSSTVYFTNISICGTGTNTIEATANINLLFGYNTGSGVCSVSNICLNGDGQDSDEYLLTLDKGIWHGTGFVLTNMESGLQVLNVMGCFDHFQIWSDDGAGSSIEIWAPGIDGYGDQAWANSVPYGTTNIGPYFENGFLSSIASDAGNFSGGLSSIDVNWGGAAVIRYVDFTNVAIQLHGNDTTGRGRSGRAVEVYDDIFTEPARVNQDPFCSWRGGSGVLFSNTLINALQLANLVDYRVNGFNPGADSGSPFGSANGLNSWDSNNPSVQASGTATSGSASKVLVDSSQSWTVNQFAAGYVLQDVTKGGTNDGDFALITSNSSDAIYCNNESKNGDYIDPSSGDRYAVYRVYSTLDMPGIGSGQLLTNNPPTNAVIGGTKWPFEAFEPIYAWGNSNAGAAAIIESTANYPIYNNEINGINYSKCA